MYVISSKKKPRKVQIPVGHYSSYVTDICYAEEYADEEAIKVYYKLTNADGESFEYTEVFHNDADNERTKQFFEYLEAAGIQEREDGLPDLVGFSENLTLKRKVGYSRPVIVQRDPT